MAIIDLFKELLQTIAHAFGGGSSKDALNPSELTKAVLDAAKAGAKDWDDQLDLPNAFEIRIPKGEWDSYYGSRVRQTEARLSRSLEQFASEVGATMEEPVITITVDSTVPCSDVAVNASFTAPSGLPLTPVLAVGANKEGARGGESWSTTPLPEKRPTEDGVTPTNCAADKLTPRISLRTARVSVPGGSSFEVVDGSTIGIVRDPSRERPTICLPYAEALYFAAQIQGKFRYENGFWRFENQGRNGTFVLRDSTTTQVVGDSFALEDNDMLCFGTAEAPAVVFNAEVA